MKRLLIVFMMALGLATCLCLTCYATEAEAENIEALEIEEDVASVESHTLFSRIYEFAIKYKSELLNIFGQAVLFLIAFAMKKKLSASTNDINTSLEAINANTGLSVSNDNQVISVVNSLIDSFNVMSSAYENMKTAYEKYGESENDRNKVVAVLASEVQTVLDILATVYPNNKNVPQGIKDLVSLKYAKCLKAADSDNVTNIIKAVRNILDGADEAPENSTEA